LEVYDASSLKQQSACRQDHSTRIYYLNPEPINLSPSHECRVLSREAANINIKVFVLTWAGLEPTIYSTQGEHTNCQTTYAFLPWKSWKLAQL